MNEVTTHAKSSEIRLHNPLFKTAEPDTSGDFIHELNPMSLETLTASKVEPALALATPGEPVQFERQGYFCLDPLSAPDHLIFNRTVGLRDSWTKARATGN